MSTLLEKLAEKLAEDAVEQARLAKDADLIDAVAKSLADTSTTFKEAFLTCVRYIQAEERARALLPNVAPQPEGLRLPAPEEPEQPRRKRRNVGRILHDGSEADDGEEAIEYADVEYLDDEEPAAAQPAHMTQAQTRRPEARADAETPAVEPEITEPRKRSR